MKHCFRLFYETKSQNGAVLVLVAVLMVVFIGITALAIDVGHLFVVRNELQNAADAGALAGTLNLYYTEDTAPLEEDISTVNPNANQFAFDTTVQNLSDGNAVEVNQPLTNEEDVQRGHWTFATRTFTPSDSLAPIDLWNTSTEELDAMDGSDGNPPFINAVRVVTRREATPVVSFFARIFGYDNFTASTEAVAYIGFAGKLVPGDVDQPIAICMDSIRNADEEYTCNVGRMINSGQNVATNETGGWTDFSQDNPCTGGTNAQDVRGLVCEDGNEEIINLGENIATNGGEIQSAFNSLITCWENETSRTGPWNLTLPVVTCPGNNITTCQKVMGAVNLNIMWITEAGEDPSYNEAPTMMSGVPGYTNWDESANPNGAARWASFVDHFNLQNVDGSPAPYAKKSIYFLPDCSPHEPKGGTGGENFGILAKIPVLVD